MRQPDHFNPEMTDERTTLHGCAPAGLSNLSGETNMQTDTTIRAGVETAAIPPRAAGDMAATVGKKPGRRPGKRERDAAKAPASATLATLTTETAHTKAAATEDHAVGQDDLKDKIAQTAPDAPAPTLTTLLAKRNAALVQAEAAYAAERDAEGDRFISQMNELETTILEAPGESLDDAVAKLALVAQVERLGLCFDRDKLEVIGRDIGLVMAKAAYPARVLPPAERGSWVFVPEAPAETSDFTASLGDLVAKARAYSAEFVEPADKAHSAADHAKMCAPPEGKGALDEVVETAWKAWEDHCSVYRSMVEPILALTPATPEQLLWQVDAYADLMGVHWARNPKANTPLGRLGEDEVDEIAEHMHASLKRLVGGEGGPIMPMPDGPVAPAPTSVNVDTARAAIVVEAADYAKLVRQAQDAFNEADEAWVKDKDDRTPGLAEQRRALEDTWADRLERHHDIAKRVFDLPVSSPDEVAAHVAAYAEIMAPLVCRPGETEVDDLPRENLLVIIDYLSGRARPAICHGEWQAAVSRLEEAAKAYHAAFAAQGAIKDAIAKACPLPEALVSNLHELPFRERRYHLAESSIDALKIPLAKKAEMARALAAHHEAEVVEKDRLGWQAADDAREAAFDAWRAAQTAMVAMPSPTVEAVTEKAWAMILDNCLEQEAGEPTPARLGKLLIAEGGDYVAVRIYQDLVRLSGGPAEVADYTGFDPATWLAEFESKPGCVWEQPTYPHGSKGYPTFEKDAFDPPLLTDQDFLISDPEVLARYTATVTEKYGQAHTDHRRSQDPDFATRPMIASYTDPAWLFAADDPRYAEWTARQETFRAQNIGRRDGTVKPVFGHLWSDLEQWQKAQVQAHALARKAAS